MEGYVGKGHDIMDIWEPVNQILNPAKILLNLS